MIRVLDTTSIGAPIVRKGIALFPTYVHQHLPFDIATGTDLLEVTEVDGGVVPVLRVTNHGAAPVLIPEGETVVGGRQNRVFNVSVLVPGDVTIDVPVSCVERGRWNDGHRFDRAGFKATRRVRREMIDGVQDNLRRSGRKQADQGRVWSSIDRELASFDAVNDTSALHAVRERPRDGAVMRSIDELLTRGPLPQQCGVVVGRGSRILGAEVFATPELLRDNWRSIVTSVMLEADGRSGRPSATRALSFLHHVAAAPSRREPGVGAGHELHVRTRSVVGQALLFDEVVVHASAFALAA
jgi:hypothetical protein